ncbi:MAG: Hpt domain-containing protein [Clostridiales bacterium]|nr:Hpt domain-containing protein [Clostridiales bacterium]
MDEIIKTLKDANFDVDGTLERFAGNFLLLNKFLVKFLDDKSYEGFKNAIAANDYQAAEATIHTLKGVAGNLGLTDLFNISNDILTQIRQGTPENVPAKIPALDSEYSRVIAVIEKVK